MEIERNEYLHELVDRKGNGLVKVITGIRRCGKSYLPDVLFKERLHSQRMITSEKLHTFEDRTRKRPVSVIDYISRKDNQAS